MSGGIGRRLKAIAILFFMLAFLLAAFAGLAAGKAGARASLRGYLTAAPNTWEFMGFNATGTVPNFVTNHLGWNVSRTFGNVGIGDGSPRALNLSSNVNDIGYTGNYIVAGDVSTSPWSPARIKDFSIAEENLPKTNVSGNASEATAESEVKELAGDHNEETAAENNVEQGAEHGEIPGAGVSFGSAALNDPFHTVLVGRPVGDLLYEHPHGISASVYSRLVGLRMPGGAVANIGMRAIGYGY